MVSRQMCQRLRFIAFSCCISVSFPALAHQDLVDKRPESVSSGIGALKEGNAQKALDFFNTACRQDPASAEAHLGRACALMKLERKDEAIKEYKLVLLLEPESQSAKKAADELARHGIISQGKAADKQGKESSSSQPGPATVRAKDVESSILSIQKQSEEKIQNIHADAEGLAHSIYSSKMDAHNRLMERLRKEEEEMRKAKMMFGRRLVPAFSEEHIRDTFQGQHMRAAAYLGKAKADYEDRKQEAESRALGIKSSAEGLQSQMISKPSESSGIYLDPNGTNLYVRNYGHFDPILPEPPVPLEAVPLKLPELIKKEAELEKAKKELKRKKKHR